MLDIPLGKMFCKWLRNNGHEPDDSLTYKYSFIDNKKFLVKDKLYPNELLTAFNTELENWIINKSVKYLSGKDKSSYCLYRKRLISL